MRLEEHTLLLSFILLKMGSRWDTFSSSEIHMSTEIHPISHVSGFCFCFFFHLFFLRLRQKSAIIWTDKALAVFTFKMGIFSLNAQLWRKEVAKGASSFCVFFFFLNYFGETEPKWKWAVELSLWKLYRRFFPFIALSFSVNGGAYLPFPSYLCC